MKVYLVRMKKSITNEIGEVKNYTNYYLILDNGSYIPIKPAFNNDYKVLYNLADEIKDDKTK